MWNEEEYIDRAIAFGRRACERLVAAGDIADYELIIVDDCSTDSTGRRADELAAEDPRVRVEHHTRNRKLGGSIRTGLASATGDVVLYTDADLPFDMTELPRLVRLLREYDADIISAYQILFPRPLIALQKVLFHVFRCDNLYTALPPLMGTLAARSSLGRPWITSTSYTTHHNRVFKLLIRYRYCYLL